MTKADASLKRVGYDVGGESSDLIRYPENHHEIGSGDIGGQYVMDDVQGHWQTWQASRAAIEIELQKPSPLP